MFPDYGPVLHMYFMWNAVPVEAAEAIPTCKSHNPANPDSDDSQNTDTHPLTLAAHQFYHSLITQKTSRSHNPTSREPSQILSNARHNHQYHAQNPPNPPPSSALRPTQMNGNERK